MKGVNFTSQEIIIPSHILHGSSSEYPIDVEEDDVEPRVEEGIEVSDEMKLSNMFATTVSDADPRDGAKFFFNGEYVKGTPGDVKLLLENIDPLPFTGDFEKALIGKTKFPLNGIFDVESVKSIIAPCERIEFRTNVKYLKVLDGNYEQIYQSNPKFYETSLESNTFSMFITYEMPTKFTFKMLQTKMLSMIRSRVLDLVKRRSHLFCSLFDQLYADTFAPVQISDDTPAHKRKLLESGNDVLNKNKAVQSGELHEIFKRHNPVAFVTKTFVKNVSGIWTLVWSKVYKETSESSKSFVYWDSGDYDEIKAEFEPTKSGTFVTEL